MNKKMLISSVATLSAFFLTTAHADIRLFPSGISGQDMCTQFPGDWKGSGIMQTTAMKCYYVGTANVTQTSGASYSIKMDLTKDSSKTSSRACLSEYHDTFDDAKCTNGVIDIEMNGVEITGNIYSKNNVVSADLSGTAGTATVSMHIDKTP